MAGAAGGGCQRPRLTGTGLVGLHCCTRWPRREEQARYFCPQLGTVALDCFGKEQEHGGTVLHLAHVLTDICWQPSNEQGWDFGSLPVSLKSKRPEALTPL